MEARHLQIAEALDAYRVVPRAWLMGYGFMLYRVTEWFMQLPDPTGPQTGLVTTVWGAGAVITGFYVNTGRRWQ